MTMTICHEVIQSFGKNSLSLVQWIKPRMFANFHQRWREFTDCKNHRSWTFTKNRDIKLDQFSWFFEVIILQMWQSFTKVDDCTWYNSSGLAQHSREELRNLWILCQTNCQVLPDISYFGRVSPIKDVQPISIACTWHSSWFYSHQSNSWFTGVGHRVQRVVQLLSIKE